MKSTFFARLTYLEIRGSLGRGIQFMDDFFITNDKSYISRIVDDRFRPAIGSLEFKFLRDGPIAYYTSDNIDTNEFEKHCGNLLNTLIDFEHRFWTIQDCCVGHEVGFTCGDNTITSVRHGGYYTLATGLTDTLTCSADTFSEAVRHLRTGMQKLDISKASKTHPTKNISRIRLGLDFVGSSQLTAFIPKKIAFYCSALEALLATSQSELSHQVAERVAVLADTNMTRLALYKFIKKCYNLRSKYIHGDTVALPESEIAGISAALDAVVRATFNAIFNDSELREALDNKTRLDEVLLQRILQPTTSA